MYLCLCTRVCMLMHTCVYARLGAHVAVHQHVCAFTAKLGLSWGQDLSPHHLGVIESQRCLLIVAGGIMFPPKKKGQSLSPGSCECDLTGKSGLCRCDQI